MTVPKTTPANSPTTPAPAAPAAPAAPSAGRDTYGDRKVSLTDMPLTGYQTKRGFVPAEEGKKPTPKQEPEPTPADDTAGKEGAPENEGGQPAEAPEAPAAATPLKAKNGKTFKDAAELLESYDASAPEAKRLADENKTFKLTMDDISAKLTDANSTILKMEEYIANSAYTPNVPEKYKGMTETEMLENMTEDEKLDYKLDKREWKRKVESFKTQMANAKAEAESIAKQTKAEIAKAEQVMSQDTASYPDFTDLTPLREEIMRQSPHLANRPDSPYVTYYMAMGILALKERTEASRLEAQSRQAAEGKAKSAAAAAGSGAPASGGKSPAPKAKDDGLRGLVKAGKDLKGYF